MFVLFCVWVCCALLCFCIALCDVCVLLFFVAFSCLCGFCFLCVIFAMFKTCFCYVVVVCVLLLCVELCVCFLFELFYNVVLLLFVMRVKLYVL